MRKRAFAIAGLIAAGTIVPLATATPASATVAQCTGVLHDYGYSVGAKSTTACSYPHTTVWGHSVGHWNCIIQLEAIGVRKSHAETACSWA